MKVYFPKEIDVSDITYKELTALGESQAKVAYMNLNDQMIYVQTPLMSCPYGLSSFEGDGGRMKYSLDLSFGGDSDSVKVLKEFLEKIDEKVLDDSTKNSLTWFKKKSQSRDVSSALFTPSIKVATEDGEPTDKYPPTFKVKVPFYDDKFKVQCYNDSRELITDPFETLVGKGQRVRAIVKLAGIWFAGGKFGMKWDLYSLKLTPKTRIEAYAFEDSDDEEEDGNSENNTPVATDGNDYVLSSEDEL